MAEQQAHLAFVPANEAPWEDLMAVMGSARCHGNPCFCQRFTIRGWRNINDEQRELRFREQTQCEDPRAEHTTGFLAYLDEEPVAWCAIEPRTAYPGLLFSRIPWAGRDEDETDESVWLASCFIVRKEYRRRGFTYDLARAAVDFARERGAKALEGFAMLTEPGKTITWDELHVGSQQIFEAAGFHEVSHPTKRRVVMRKDFD